MQDFLAEYDFFIITASNKLNGIDFKLSIAYILRYFEFYRSEPAIYACGCKIFKF